MGNSYQTHNGGRFLAPLAVGKLPGVGKVMEAKLAELGIHTCYDLRSWCGAAATALRALGPTAA